MNIWARHGPRIVSHLRYRAHIPQSICTVFVTLKHVWQFSRSHSVGVTQNLVAKKPVTLADLFPHPFSLLLPCGIVVLEKMWSGEDWLGEDRLGKVRSG